MQSELNRTSDDLRHSLIIAGINEIELHGLTDFSLRRVATACGVSCAAPYRHFKSKGDLILAIISYINDQWSFLERQIFDIYNNDTRKLILELATANIRFWIANPNFRSIMMMDDRALDALQLRERSRISDEIGRLISLYCKENLIDAKSERQSAFAVRAIIYGATQMLGSGELENTAEAMEIIRSRIEANLPK